MKQFVDRHPAVFMVAATYLWTWSFWFTALFVLDNPQGLRLSLIFLGGFGPALAGILTLRIQGRVAAGKSRKLGAFAIGVLLAVVAIALLRFNVLNVTAGTAAFLDFPSDSPMYVYLLMALTPLVSGFVFSSIQSRNQRLSLWFAGLVPDKRTLLLAIPVVLFFPTLLIASNVLADILGMEYTEPKYLQDSVSAWLPVMFVKMFTVALLTGGNEEHGWRGVLQPLLQKWASPLVAALIIGVIWELWHLPIVLGGVYGEGEPLTIIVSRLVNVVPVALLLAIVYNGSRGSIFLCVLFHACFNSQAPLFFGSPIASLVGIVVVLIAIFVLRMWRGGTGYVPARDRS